MKMDLEKVSILLDEAIESIDSIEQGDATPEEALLLQWRVMSKLASANSMANSTSIRAPGQLLVRRLVTEECERLVDRCRRAVGIGSSEV